MYATSGNVAPTMYIPENVDGFIDLETLKDINRYLRTSSTQDDQELAQWIEERYLYLPLDTFAEPGRKIRTATGFSQLDRAYRRVRQLTGKAQDKWPFFDRNWKAMSTSTVRNNARGEAAPGVKFPGLIGNFGSSSTISGNVAQQALPTPPGFVPFGPKAHTRNKLQSASQPISKTPIPLPLTKSVRFESNPGSEMRPAIQQQPVPDKRVQQDSILPESQPKSTDTPMQSESLSSAPTTPAEEGQSGRAEGPEEATARLLNATKALTDERIEMRADDTARDAGKGKVRGNDGRFLTQPGSIPRKTRRSSDGRRKSARNSVVNGADGEPESKDAPSPAAVDAEDETMEDQPSSPVSVPQETETEQQNRSEDTNVPPADDDAPAPAPSEVTPRSIRSKTQTLLEKHHLRQEPQESSIDLRALDASSGQSHDEPATSVLSDYMDLSKDPEAVKTVASLAAEADPVSSNLDRLPLNSTRKNKRKSDTMDPPGPPKKRGRPRKEDVESNAEAVPQVTNENEAPSEENPPVEEEAPRMATRRSTRRSTAANLDEPPAALPEPTKQTPKKQRQPAEVEDQIMVDVDDADTNAGHQASLPVPATTATTPRSIRSKNQKMDASPLVGEEPRKDGIDLLALGLRKTDPPTEHAKPKQRAAQEPAKETESLPNGTGQTASADNGEALTKANESGIQNGLGKVEYLARVHTSAGVVDVPLPSDKLAEEAELVQKYADWMATKGAAQVTFEVFKSIFAIAKPR